MNTLRAGVLAVMIALPACSVMDVFSMFTPSDGISLDAQIGDKEIHTEVAGKKETSNYTAESITNVANTVNEAEPLIPWLVAMLFLMLPTPTRMWLGIKGLFRRK